jgi:hypothetical protein
MGLVAGKTGKGGSEICEQLGKKDLAAGGAITLQANRIWLVSGATVTLNFLKQKAEWDLPLQLAKIWQ